MHQKTVHGFALLVFGGVLSACGSHSSGKSEGDPRTRPEVDSGSSNGSVDGGSASDSGVERFECPALLVAPSTTGCDGLSLTDPASIDAKSDSIADTSGPSGASALRIQDSQFIDIKNDGCLQLGKAGGDFSLSMWLKATGASQIIGTTSQYSRAQGFILTTNLRADGDLELLASSAPTSGDFVAVTSLPFKAGVWVHVGLRYDNRGDGSMFAVDVNLDEVSGPAAPDVYNDKLRIGDEGYGSIVPFEVSELHSYGRLLSDRELKALFLDKADAVGVSASNLASALDLLEGQVGGKAPLSPTDLDAAMTHFIDNAAFLDVDADLMKRALDLVHGYETGVGPLFMTDATKKGIPRTGTAGDGLELARAMVSIQQTILEKVFTADNVRGCQSLLDGKRFLTADYFPGAAEPPTDPTESHEATISASSPAYWGRPVAFATEPVRRPTGLYLSPGSIGKVTVPQSMIGAGYSVLVGAHTADHANKSTHTRLDRVTRTFPITSKDTYVANPLGGGVYILVPYLADLGLVKVSISGVIDAPFFSLKSFDTTTAADWKQRRTAPGPWADFETDKFMMQLPSSWIYASEDPTEVLKKWDKAMDGVSELLGFPPEKRNRTVLYEQVDVQIRHGAFGIGYPQVNNTYDPTQIETGNKQYWMLTDPTSFEIDFHELGHSQLMTKFRGEPEAIVNFPHSYVTNVKFGVDYDLAFQRSFGPSYGSLGFSPDDAAINWMVTDNFIAGKEMDYSNTTKDQFRYQQRGYAKYADMYRIFGWQPLRDFYHQEHVDYMNHTPSDGLDPVDSRILRLSIAAGGDVTPLIHFWGIHPVNAAALKQQIAAHGLGVSQAVCSHIARYKTVAPKNNTDFKAHFARIYPKCPCTGGDPDYGPGWYNPWLDKFDATRGAQIQAAIQGLLDLYQCP